MNSIGKVIQIAIATDHENGEFIMVLTQDGKIFEQAHMQKKICYGTYEISNGFGKDAPTKRVNALRYDRYVAWREVSPITETALLHKGAENYKEAKNFEPCEEREIL